jgi:hypothetical protein
MLSAQVNERLTRVGPGKPLAPPPHTRRSTVSRWRVASTETYGNRRMGS